MRTRRPATTRFSRCFSADTAAPAAARRFCRDVLQCYGLDTLARDADLLLSELVTNAVVHATPPLTVHAQCIDATVHVDVDDGSPRHHPLPTVPNPDDDAGRGVFLVDRLATRWGVEEKCRVATV